MSDTIRAVLILSAAVSAMFLAHLYRWSRRHGDPLEVFSIIAAIALGIEYCLRPLAIATTGELGWDPTTFRPVTSLDSHALAYASLLSTLCIAVFCAIIQLVCGGSPANSVRGEGLFGARAAPRRRAPTAAILLFFGVASLVLGSTYGGFSSVFSGSFGRSHLTSGYLYSLVNVASAAILVTLAIEPVEVLKRRRVRLALTFAALAALAVDALILGGRAEILTAGVGALVLLRCRTGGPSNRRVIAAALIAIAASSIYRVATREVHYTANAGYSSGTLVARSLSNPLSLVTRGDVSSFDKIVVLEEGTARVSPGSTYVAALLAPVPGKPTQTTEGGSRAFTRLYLPARYAMGTTYEGVSLAGEGILNFGPIGAVLAFAALGVAFAVVLRIARGRVSLALAIATGVFPSIIRADAFNAVALTLAFALASALVLYVRYLLSVRDRRNGSRARTRTAEHSAA